MIVGIVAWACAATCPLLGTLATFKMAAQVNDKMPEAERFNPLGWYYSKRRNNTTLYPDGRLLLRARILMALMFASGMVAAWSFGAFPR
jgi:hypothetical protein